jgi:signal transduction histidine kinase
MPVSWTTVYLPLLAAAAYTILLLVQLARSQQRGLPARLLLGYLAASVAWAMVLVLKPAPAALPNLPWQVLPLGTLLLAVTTASYVEWAPRRRWLGVGAVAIGVTVLMDLIWPVPLWSASAVWAVTPTAGGVSAVVIWLVLTLTILTRTWDAYQDTRLPWHANRLLHWDLFVFVAFAGEVLLLFAASLPATAGQLLRFAAALGLMRAVTSHRLFDVRVYLRHVLATLLIGTASALPAALLVGLLLWLSTQQWLTGTQYVLLTLFSVAVAFMLYQPYRRVFERFAYRYLLGREFRTGAVLRQYSQAISQTLDVVQLSLVIISTISDLMQTTRGALMIVNRSDDGYEVEPVPAAGQLAPPSKHFPADSPFIRQLTEHQPVLQYDLDFSPIFDEVPAEERNWLREQAMDVFVPVLDAGRVTGLIALGPKRSGLAYRPNELDLVQTLADQTVVSLQNARLYRALNQQNERIRQLNADLRRQNERLEMLDKIKSDFITIASHELRTPLTQVKGYADILEAMNEEETLTRMETREIVSNISRASQRLEALITAMLDASQLEVSGVALSYIRTRVEAVIRYALEPLQPALAARHLVLKREGLEEIPAIHADFKRLVQAFNNIVSNAIKYTPDHGTITISAHTVPSVEARDYVEVVISDTGIGIDPNYHEMVFEKFFRIGSTELHSTGSTKFMGAGPGLGLHIAKGVIEAHGGHVWIESEGEDKARFPGTSVHVILPLWQPESDAETAPEAAPAPAAADILPG